MYWIATNSDGVVHFDLAGTPPGQAAPRSRFTVYQISPDPVTNRVNVLYRDRAGSLWAGTDGGLFRMDGAQQAFRPVILGIPAHPDIQVPVWALVEDAAGDLWIGTRFGLVRRSADGRMTHFDIQPTAVDDNVWALLFERTCEIRRPPIARARCQTSWRARMGRVAPLSASSGHWVTGDRRRRLVDHYLAKGS